MPTLTKKTRFTPIVCAVVGVFVFASPTHAETLYESLQSLVKNQRQIKAAEADLGAAKERAAAAWGDWYPELSVTANWGREKQNKASGTADTEEHPREVDISITQKLWDFGSTNAAIKSAKLSVDRARTNLMSTRQALVLQGIEAHLNLLRSNKVLGFAKGSVDNIRRQAKLEDARVQRGGGFTTDVLQAKTQLAGAEARRNNFAGALRNAINAYRRFFGKTPGKINKLDDPRAPVEMVPKSVDELIQAMHKDNPGLKASHLDAEILEQTIRQTRADEFFPTLDATAETKRKEDVGGTIARSTEQLFKIELSYSLNLGLTERNTLMAAKKDHLAGTERYIDARDSFEQQARDLWSNFERDKENAEFLRNQANIAAEFLELARRERQLGNRSLIDVLAGETALINANSDAAAAETDIKLDVFRILNIMGKLEADILQKS
ncbi:MAG: TolC family protein [Alphaproteobacteria bacterium]|nr:TolC family protein [Alphaproteobacteria bacterium]